ncbi:hypothetical protein ONS95_008272 [Cadophora gregata]|uniref:uncharacterized protein n=1 Tax=Cadophora gregata TaxID=51156 RepID=UPI0026DB85DB|nr:uncharacterized protein ONS95_008272 [Cadophora gregata]KAK0100315.1 hypothetical protein ONS96_007595 [Cadophora gregata f. sp. sojae]KAK0126691.1 hypothetical protein ONS95_008272 [Cadophora gregata]
MAAATSPGRMSFNALDLENGPFRTTAIDNVSQPPQSPRLDSPGPLPLPSFVFPARAPSPTSTSSRSAPSSYSRASGRRPLSAIEIRNHSKERTGDGERLPEFSFGSSSSSTVSPSLVSPKTIPARPSSMHQRNVSEFIGGDGKTGAGAGLISSSPTKSEGALPPPAAAFGPPGGRRGHAHRRSAAISVSDLTFILKPNPNLNRGGSAPTSPSAMHEQHPVVAASLDAALQTARSMSDLADPEPSPKAFKNTRVGFSDEVSIIPRPLSMVSSDSSSTVRPGHSVSNSMSSIVSAGTSSPSSKEKRSMPSTYRTMDTRPRTAEPILDRDQLGGPENTPRRRGSLPLLNDVAAGSTPSTPRSAKKWSFFGHESHSGESSPKSRPTSAASSAKESKKAETAPSSPDLVTPDLLIQSTEPSSRRSSISRKPSKNKKKVRMWAGSILSRKSRHRKPKLSRRSPTPPLRAYAPADQTNDFNLVDSEQPVLIRPEAPTDFTNWKPRRLPPQEESMSPIIDLDAALGPFNTPSSFGDDWDMSQQSGKRKRAMHSAAGLGGFTGPGMHYHRRAESAPEFENPRFGLHRLGSNSTMGMEDVFEEDEDEEWEDAKASDKETSSKAGDPEDDEESGLGIDIKVVDSDGMDSDNPMDFDDAAFQRGLKRKGSGLSEGDRRHMSSTKSAHSTTSLVDEPIEEEESSPVEIVDDSFPPRPDSRAQSSDSTATPPFRPNPAKDLTPVDIQPFSLQPPFLTPTSPRSASQSSFPSPRSPFSYDTQRISTAPSSVTDENAFQSLLMGEPGPELRMSVDDVPSLTSSNSTMTRDNSGNHPQFRDGQRSASLSSAAVTRKRSSMASLSRLISSSHGEKSKLSIESRAPSVSDVERKEKSSKAKRISRLMQFWKPKESSPSTQ